MGSEKNEMSKTEELLKLAEAATPGPWRSYEDVVTFPWPEGGFCLADGPKPRANADFIAAANPETIKALIVLVRLQHDALKADALYAETSQVAEVLAAFNKWESGK